jgi:hypothetical protein
MKKIEGVLTCRKERPAGEEELGSNLLLLESRGDNDQTARKGEASTTEWSKEQMDRVASSAATVEIEL